MLRLRPGMASFTRAANLFEYRGENDRAVEALRRAEAIAVTPSDKAYCLQRQGELAWNSGDAARALQEYRQALSHDSGHVAALAGAARAHAALGHTGEALRSWRLAVDRSPQPAYLLEYGEFLESIGRPDEARAQYAVVRAESRLGPPDNLTLGRLESDHGDPVKAVRLLTAEWTRRPNAIIADAYAWALHRAGRDREALIYARKADSTGFVRLTAARHRHEIQRTLGGAQ